MGMTERNGLITKTYIKNCSTQNKAEASLVAQTAENARDPGSVPGLGSSRRREWTPTPLFLPGKSQRQRRRAGYSPRGHRVGVATRLTRTLPTCSLPLGHPEAHSFPTVGEAASNTQMPPRESVLYHNFLVISLLFSILPY